MRVRLSSTGTAQRVLAEKGVVAAGAGHTGQAGAVPLVSLRRCGLGRAHPARGPGRSCGPAIKEPGPQQPPAGSWATRRPRRGNTSGRGCCLPRRSIAFHAGLAPARLVVDGLVVNQVDPVAQGGAGPAAQPALQDADGVAMHHKGVMASMVFSSTSTQLQSNIEKPAVDVVFLKHFRRDVFLGSTGSPSPHPDKDQALDGNGGILAAFIPGAPTSLESGPSVRKATQLPSPSKVAPW